MLSPISKKRQWQSFLTFDLEWEKGRQEYDRGDLVLKPQVRLAGAYDEARGYRWYQTIQGFLEHELVKENAGKWFYAHAGGLADMLFVLEWLVDQDRFEVEASFSGSSAIIVRVRRKRTRDTWVFVDSLWLLKGPLAEIAKTVGMEKGDVEFDNAPLSELVPYNEQDCVILYRAIEQFQQTLIAMGGELKMTLASSAMALFRRKYLKRHIITNRWVNDKARKAYYASRVEVFQFEANEVYYYDINSSFPYAMTYACPGNLTNTDTRIRESRLQDEDYLFLGDFTIESPEQYLPPVPTRYDGSVYFPVGRWRAWFSSIDIALLLKRGGRVLKTHEVLFFDPHYDLRDYAYDVYAKRKDAEKRGDEMQRYVYKLLLNSLYGKFAEGELKTSLVINPRNLGCPHAPAHDTNPLTNRPECMDMLFPGAFLIENERDVPHAHVPISVFITARARRVLYDYMAPCKGFHYCDTDGFSSEEPNLKTGKELGDLKLEKVETARTSYFVRPKIYQIGDNFKAKGFTLKPDKQTLDRMSEDERHAYEQERIRQNFLQVVHGGQLEMMRFARVRELYRKGMVTPQERQVRKRLRFDVKEKRKRVGNDTRPWDVREIYRDEQERFERK